MRTVLGWIILLNLMIGMKWISEYDKGRLLIIDVDDINFSENEEDLGSIIQKIDAEINGLF